MVILVAKNLSFYWTRASSVLTHFKYVGNHWIKPTIFDSIKCKTKNAKLLRPFTISSSLREEMITFTLVKADGSTFKRSGRVGETIRDIIGDKDPDFPGYGACEGTLSCSTCHLIFSEEIFKKLPTASEEEIDLILYAPDNCERSRLACAVTAEKDMDGMVVKIPSQVTDHRGPS